MHFCHIAPTPHLDLVKGAPVHLCLAHLVESDPVYEQFYLNESKHATIILDNSAFEMYKQGRPMYPSDKLIEMGERIGADYIVLSDYPGEAGAKTIAAAERLAPLFRSAGFKTFFVPQSRIGDMRDLHETFAWAARSQHVDYIGVSILGIPNGFGVEKGNKLQRYLSRRRFFDNDSQHYDCFLHVAKENGKKIHFLGMVDGPNEIELMGEYVRSIDTWDSSAAIWAGLNLIPFDESPTGLINGKFEKEVDFQFHTTDETALKYVQKNMAYIQYLTWRYSRGKTEIATPSIGLTV